MQLVLDFCDTASKSNHLDSSERILGCYYCEFLVHDTTSKNLNSRRSLGDEALGLEFFYSNGFAILKVFADGIKVYLNELALALVSTSVNYLNLCSCFLVGKDLA